jgi:uncharacterized protein YndB with AHSA1/START domain
MTESISRFVDAAPARVMDVLTDVRGLPAWNSAITGTVEAPAELAEGVEWVVELSALGQSWHSRSRVLELSREAGVFAYRSCTDDGNPSYARWRWQVSAAGQGSDVTVTWSLHPQTFWRRVLLVRIRERQLARHEVPGSLAALESACRAPLAHD